jgi:acetolactate synthase-1/2/3 large subunit
MRMTGAKAFVEMLKREGVEVIFGFPGGAVLHIYDALFDADIKHILVRHEQGAVHAADGYARASGKPGVVLVTSGPGATNTVTGIATAYMDSVPVVVFTGQVPTHLIGNDAFQEADIVGITRPCTKHNYLVKNVEDLPRIIKEAFYIATTGRPGPVLVDLPKDIIAAEFEFQYPEKVEIRGYKPVLKGHPLQIKKAVEEILSSTRPVIYGGGGLIHSNASKLLIELAEMLNIPVTLTLMGLGAFPGDHPLFLGMLGMHGTFYANSAVDNCDLLIAIGARFDDRVTGKVSEFAKGARIIHIDIDPSSISKSIKVDIPIVGDASHVLSDILKLLKEKYKAQLPAFRNKMKPWLKQIEMWKKNHPLTYKMDNTKIKPQYVVERIYELTKGKAIITTEVGQNQMWAAQFYKFSKPRTFLTSGGLGTMGYGFPAAIGAQIAKPDAIVIDIAGDGSIQMNIQELATAVQYRLPVKVAILNNRFLGMVRQWQELFYGKRYSMSCLHCHPDFVKLAEAYGAVGLRAEKPSEVDAVIKTALKVKDKPVLMDFLVDREEGVYPMVPAGAPLREMLLV